MRSLSRVSTRSLVTAVISLGLIGAAGQVSAETMMRHHHPHHPMVYAEQPPLNVNKRSWLDPGNQVEPGAEHDYVVESTYFHETPDQEFFPSRFHEDATPRPLYVPGGDVTPVVRFWTPRDPLGTP
ncbi:MAG: hypothetical protein ABSC72_01050 [Methylovirgula sp.]|jgi:hypothetical protein